MTPEEVKTYAKAHVRFRANLDHEQLHVFDQLRRIEQAVATSDHALYMRVGFGLGVAATIGALLSAAGIWALLA